MYEQGVYWLLSSWPTWVIMVGLLVLVSFAFCGGIPRKGRISTYLWSSSYICPLVVVFITIGILKHGLVFVPVYYLQFGWFHWVILVVMVLIGILACLIYDENRVTEVFRNTVVDPLFVFFLITLVPIVYANGTLGDKVVTSIFALGWVVPFVIRISLGLAELIEEKTWRYHGNVNSSFD